MKIKQKLRELSKDGQAFAELKEIFAELENSKHSLELLENAIQHSYDSIMITDIELDKPGPKIVYVNKGFTEITGYTRREVIGKTPRILQGPKTDQKVLDKLKNRLKEGRPFYGKTVNYRKDGSEFVNQWDVHPLTDDQGNLTHWVSYQHDITERKRAEEVVMDTKIDFDQLREHASSAFVDTDQTGTIRTCSKSFREFMGFRKDELEGTKIWTFFPKKGRKTLKKRFNNFNKEDFQQETFRNVIHHKEGFPIQIEGVTKVLNLKEGPLIRANIKNISLKKRIMETLQERNKNYRNIVNQASEYNYLISLENGSPVIEYISDHFTDITGIATEEVVQANAPAMFIHEDDLDKYDAFLEEVADKNSATCKYRIKQSSGNYQLAVDAAKVTNDVKGNENVQIKGAVSLVN